jgi:outer membrane protein assembly factor BamA
MRLLALLLLGSTISVSAQLATQGPQAVYEGQSVVAVDLIANPHRDVSPLRSAVTQNAGEPYSQSKIEASIVALEKRGDFPKVTVNVVPDVSGLRLNFLLEPAYYIGVVDFPGAPGNQSYTRLLQVVDLPDEDPYDQARIPVAESALRAFLAENGYFQATVRARSAIDDVNQLVNISFDISSGKRARIGDVDIHGADPSENARLDRSLRSWRARFSGALLKPGKPYGQKRLERATAFIKKMLAKQQHLAGKVTVDPPRYHVDTNRADISFTVESGPVVKVQISGARLSAFPFVSGREMKKLIPIYSEGAIDRELVSEGQQNLSNYFQKKGYFDVKVKTDYQRQPDQILVRYEIDRGKKHKVGRISFTGNQHLSQALLLAQVQVKPSHFWSHGSVSQKLLKQSVSNLEALYQDTGYEKVKVNVRTRERHPRIDVTFEIEEGAQTRVGRIQIDGNNSIPDQQLAAPNGFQLREGSPFSTRRLAEDRNRISATYLEKGYLNVDVHTTVARRSDNSQLVDIAFAINEGQLVRVQKVLYLGQRHTKLSLLKETAQVPVEAPMRKGQLLEAESRLYDLNVFDWSSVGPRRPITDQTEETAVVKVHESKRNDITYGFGFEVSHRGGNVPAGTVAVPGLPTVGLGNNQIAASQSAFASPRGSIEFARRNMRGLGETASASLLLSRLDQRAIAAYVQPHFLGSNWGSLTSVSAERTTENPLFAAGLGDLSFQLERLISRKHNTRLQVRYDFNKTTLSHLLVPELVLPQDRNIHLSTFSGTLIHDTRDKPLDAHRGVFSTLNLAITPGGLGSSADFAKLFGQYAFYKPFHSLVFANSVRLGLAKSIGGSFVPTSQLFFSGGGTSLRGFPLNEAGPQRIVPFCNVLEGQSGCVNVSVPVGGRQLFILNSELRFPLGIMKALGGVVFYDGGNVYSAINFNNFVNNYTHTVGLGLRYATPVGPIRIDLGRNLNPAPGIGATQYFITLGQAF